MGKSGREAPQPEEKAFWPTTTGNGFKISQRTLDSFGPAPQSMGSLLPRDFGEPRFTLSSPEAPTGSSGAGAAQGEGSGGPTQRIGRIQGTVWKMFNGDKQLMGEFRRLNGGIDIDRVRADRDYIIPTSVADADVANANFKAQAEKWRQDGLQREAAAELTREVNRANSTMAANAASASSASTAITAVSNNSVVDFGDAMTQMHGGTPGAGAFINDVTPAKFAAGLVDMYVKAPINLVPAIASEVINGYVGLVNWATTGNPEVGKLNLRPLDYSDKFAGSLGEFGAAVYMPGAISGARSAVMGRLEALDVSGNPFLAEQALSRGGWTPQMESSGVTGVLFGQRRVGLGYDISKWGEIGLPSDGYFARTLTAEQYRAFRGGREFGFGGRPAQNFPEGMGFIGSAEEARGLTTVKGYREGLKLDYDPKYVLEFQLKDPVGLQNVIKAPYPEFVPGGKTGAGFKEWNYPGIGSKDIVNAKVRILE